MKGFKTVLIHVTLNTLNEIDSPKDGKISRFSEENLIT